jgi:hypothetical protein
MSLLALWGCGGEDAEGTETSLECSACSGVHYTCNPNNGYESFSIAFDPGGVTECRGVQERPGGDTPVRLKCDFSELCTSGHCIPIEDQSGGFSFGTTTCRE